jgi:hypothetical protein
MELLSKLTLSDKLLRLLKEKKSALDFVERKYENWNENYELYRNKVNTNRLTQRQNVNIPLMKETVKTLLSKIDDTPNVSWKELSGDQQKELIFQEIWNDDFERTNLELIDIQDKKSVLLYGRAFKKLNWVDSNIEVNALDIYDIIIDPLVDPLDIESARYIIHHNIFRNLDEIMEDDRYSKEGKQKLNIYLSSEEGIIQSSKDKEKWRDKLDRLKSMGLEQVATEESLYSGSDTVISITEHYKKVWNGTDYEKRVIVYANDTIELMDEKLEDLLGVDFYPFITWAEDIETQDFWSDSPADLIRTPNKVLNIWFSQLVENRTLRNFQMHWYDATVQGYTPQTYEPGPGRMLPAPGDPNKTIMPIEINGLDETMNAINFLTSIIERGSGATATEKGVEQQRQTTLGEVQLMVGKAMERTVAMTKMYRKAWQDFCYKYCRILEANDNKKRTLYKTSFKGKVYSKEISPMDWKSDAGYKATVASTSEQDNTQLAGIQKFMFILQQFPMNKALKKISQKRMLELVDLTPGELKEISQEEEMNEKMMIEQQAMGIQQPMPQGQPQAQMPQLPEAQPQTL